MANLTNKASYAGATSVSFNAPISLSYKYQTSDDGVTTNKGSGGASVDGRFESKQPSSPTTISVNQVDAIRAARAALRSSRSIRVKTLLP